jgi:hypothetical protein
MRDWSHHRIAILDDNPDYTELEAALITQRFPGAEICVWHEPRVEPGFDVYLLDNRFGQEERALALATQIRAAQPDSLIIVWSAYVTKDLLKKLSPVGINAVAEKGSRGDIEAALDVIERFFTRGKGLRSLGETIRSIRDLLAHWNSRIQQEERVASAL